MPCKKMLLAEEGLYFFFTLQITAYKESYYKWNFIVLQKYFCSSTKKNFGCTFFLQCCFNKRKQFCSLHFQT